MISLKDVLDWLKTLSTTFPNYYIGVLDAKKEKSLGVYNLKRSKSPIIALGGLENTSYAVKQVSLLVHWDHASDESEKIAISLYEELLSNCPTQIGGYQVQFVGLLTNEPVDVGRDDNGVCEYVIEFEIYYKRKKEV